MLQKWWKSRTIWAGVFAIVAGALTLSKRMPVEVEDGLALAGIINGFLVIYFRNTTKTGIAGAFTDNRITGSRT
jgi:hypothetical protein